MNVRLWCSGLLALTGLVGMSTAGRAEVIPVSPDEARSWTNHLLPLPHEMEIRGAILLKPADVGILLPPNAGPAEIQAATDLRSLFEERAGVAPNGAILQIVMGVLDARGAIGELSVTRAARLENCPNKEQAYLIQPEGDNRLIVAGLTGKGVYYGAQTLRQLLAPGLTPRAVRVPWATVTDWPDLEVRGLWTSPFEGIAAMAALKLNYQKTAADYPRRGSWCGELPKPKVPTNTLATFRSYAMGECLQLLYHLNYFDTYWGVYKEYPDLKGKGGEAVPSDAMFKYAQRDIAVICASNPRWKPILADMLKQVAAQDAHEVTIWLSEFAGQCQCSECLKSTQIQLESKLAVAAWQEARREYPDLTLRIFFSQGDASPATTQALADLPPEVKIERVYAVHKPFLDAAAQGRWVLSFSGADLGNTDRLYFDPQLVRQRIDQGHESKLKGVLSPWYNRVGKGRLPQAVLPRVCSFQMSVVAEWSWNTRGRTARQFLEAYGTLAGYDDPALFAQWVDAISALTENLTSRPVLELPVNHRPSSIPGLPGKMTTFESPFRAVGAKIKGRTPFAIYSPADLAAALESCRPVLTMAEKLNKPDPAVETRYLMACLHMHEQLSALSAGVVALDPGQPENRAKLRTAWNAFETSATAAVTAKERQLELWQLSPPDAEQARRELQEEWREVRMAMQAALQETVGNAEE